MRTWKPEEDIEIKVHFTLRALGVLNDFSSLGFVSILLFQIDQFRQNKTKPPKTVGWSVECRWLIGPQLQINKFRPGLESIFLGRIEGNGVGQSCWWRKSSAGLCPS